MPTLVLEGVTQASQPWALVRTMLKGRKDCWVCISNRSVFCLTASASPSLCSEVCGTVTAERKSSWISQVTTQRCYFGPKLPFFNWRHYLQQYIDITVFSLLWFPNIKIKQVVFHVVPVACRCGLLSLYCGMTSYTVSEIVSNLWKVVERLVSGLSSQWLHCYSSPWQMIYSSLSVHLKGQFTQKWKSSFPQVFPTLYEFLSSAEHKRRYFEECW